MENVTTEILDKNKEHYLRSYDVLRLHCNYSSQYVFNRCDTTYIKVIVSFVKYISLHYFFDIHMCPLLAELKMSNRHCIGYVRLNF